MRTLAVLSLLSLSLAVVGSAAAKTAATVTVSPTAPAVGDQLVFTGCGYQANGSVTLQVTTPDAYAFFGAPTDGAGCFDSSTTEVFTAVSAGGYHVDVWQAKHRPVATLDFTVV